MPIALQIYTFKRIFLSTNLGNPRAALDDIDFYGILDSGVPFEDNLENLERKLPEYCWRVPKRKSSTKTTWHQRLSKTDPNYDIYTTKVTIKQGKVKRKYRTRFYMKKRAIYQRGRIQVTVSKKWIGREATIIVKVPVIDDEGNN